MRLLLGLFLTLAVPAFGQSLLSVGAEAATSDPRYIPAPGAQGRAESATNGTDFLAVWQDSRLSGAIYGARVDANLRLLDPAGILLSEKPGEFVKVKLKPNDIVFKSPPSVVWAGTEYVVVWRTPEGVKMTRVLPSGEVIEREKTIDTGYSTSVGVGWNGTHLLLARGVPDVASLAGRMLVREITREGDPLTADAALTRPTPFTYSEPIHIVANSFAYLVLWGSGNGSAATIVDPAGTPGRSIVQSYALHQTTTFPRATTDGRRFALLNGGIISLLDSEGNEKRTYLSAYGRDWVGIVWTGREYQTFGPTEHFTADLMLKRDPNEFDPTVRTLSLFSPDPGVYRFPDGRSYPRSNDLYVSLIGPIPGARIRAATGAHPVILLASSTAQQINPAAASNGKVILAAWYEPKENEPFSRIVVGRIGADGHPLDGPGIVLSELGVQFPGVPVIGSDGDGFVVAWDEDGARGVQRIGADGRLGLRTRVTRVAGRDPSFGCFMNGMHSIAFDGSDYLVVSACPESELGAMRLSASGVPVGAPFAISAIGIDPKVTWTGTDFFVVREDAAPGGICGTVTQYVPNNPSTATRGSITIGGITYLIGSSAIFRNGDQIKVGADICFRYPSPTNDPFSEHELFGGTVTSNSPSKIVGTFVMSSGVTRKDIVVASGNAPRTQAAVATNGKTIFTAWKDDTQPELGDIHGRIFSLDGNVLFGGTADTPGVLLTAGLNNAHPSLAWDGSFYVLSWETTPRGSTTSDLMIRRFREDGSTPDPAPVVLSATPFTDDHVQLVPFGNALAAVYTRVAIERTYGGVSRVFARTVK